MLKRHLILFSFAFFCALSWGQAHPPADDPVSDQLFPPELVMQYGQEINLTTDQSKAVRDETKSAIRIEQSAAAGASSAETLVP